MNAYAFSFRGISLQALPSGALFWPEKGILTVSDLHFGKSARLSAVGGAQLPPYETRDTLMRLDRDLAQTDACHVICLGDSFDAPDVQNLLPDDDIAWIARLQAGRRWVWIAGNHDPAPLGLGGTHLGTERIGALTFRHAAVPGASPCAVPGEVSGEVSGHYHPKLRLVLRGRAISRPCFLLDQHRLILPAYGTYTGGLFCHQPPLCDLMAPDAQAILTGPRPQTVPLARVRAAQ